MMKKNNAFTMAEVLIVLATIGVVAMFTLPTFFNAAPDEDLLKFKKAYFTLQQTTDALLNSDSYPDGNLQRAARPSFEDDGSYDRTNADNYNDNRLNAINFCNSFASLLNVTTAACGTFENLTQEQIDAEPENILAHPFVLAPENVNASLQGLDALCAIGADDEDLPEIKFTTSDGVIWWGFDYGFLEQFHRDQRTEARLDYAVICFDVDRQDGGEQPFAFGVRFDGRILPGARAAAILENNFSTIAR